MKKSASQSAFFNPRILISLVLCSAGVLLALLGLSDHSGASVLARRASQSQASGSLKVVASYHNDTSPPLREMLVWPPQLKPEREANENPKIPFHHADGIDLVIQKSSVSMLSLLAPNIPKTLLNFNGIPYPGVGCNCAPPDTNGAVGNTQYVQIVNEGYQVFDKTTGNSVLGPNSISSIWTGFGGACEVGGSSDPVVLYDHLANRWIISQFASHTGLPPITDECVAVSTTSDA